MRERFDAAGKICSYAMALGMEFSVGQPRDNSNVTHRISLDNGVKINVLPDAQRFTLLYPLRISNTQSSPDTVSRPLDEVEQTVQRVHRTHTTPLISLRPLSYQPDGESVSYFDGTQARTNLFVYDSEFNLKEFHRTVNKTTQQCQKAFRETLDELDIELNADHEGVSQPSDPRGFQ